jgi:ubiquitin-protein ligase E3 A
MKALKFVIEKHGDEEDRLPSAHTCFNHLLLSEYKNKDNLKDKLLQAINNCTGFGLI